MIDNWLLLAITLIAGFWLPGWLVARRWRLPAPHVAAVLLSILTVYLLLFAGNCLGIPLTRATVLTGLGLVVLAAVATTRCRSGDGGPLAAEPVAPLATEDRWLRLGCLAIFAIALTILAIRAWRQPLTGWDTAFRWSWLAEQIFRHGHFDYYPPVTAADFRYYSYADGIPPLTQFGHFLCYVGFGVPAPMATMPVVVGQYLLIGALAWLLAAQLHGARAGWLALALCGVSPLLLWAVVMGQETGWTAIGVVATVYYLRQFQPGDWRVAVAGGAAAAVAALAREYGCAIGLLALGWCWWRGGRGRELAIIGAFGALAFSWYLRNWIITGSPVFSNNVAGLFPENSVHSAILAGYRDYLSPVKHGWVRTETGGFLLLGALAPLVIGLVGAVRRWRQCRLLILAGGLIALAWYYSIGVTAGGPRYALRVLSPVIVLAAAAGGAWLTAAPRSWLGAGLGLLIIGVGPGLASVPHYADGWDLEHAVRAVDAPRNWRNPLTGKMLQVIVERPAVVLTDNAYTLRWLRGTGIEVVPIWSPEVAFVFEADETPAAIRRRLREQGIRYLFKSNGGLNDAYLRTVPFFAADQEHWQLLFRDRHNLLFRLPE